jgi:hypothetical protein
MFMLNIILYMLSFASDNKLDNSLPEEPEVRKKT